MAITQHARLLPASGCNWHCKDLRWLLRGLAAVLMTRPATWPGGDLSLPLALWLRCSVLAERKSGQVTVSFPRLRPV